MTNIYDKIYSAEKSYHAHYSKSVYFPIWKQAERWITEPVLDIGCGPGQFAQFLLDEGVTIYTGWDISQVAINMAKEKAPGFVFYCLDAMPLKVDMFYSTVVLLEVLEHIERDIELLQNIPSGMRVVFSVPNFDSATHVRVFKDEQAARDRYGELLQIDNAETFEFSDKSRIYLFSAIKK